MALVNNLLVRWNQNYGNNKVDYSKVIDEKTRLLKRIVYERGLDIVGELPDLNINFE